MGRLFITPREINLINDLGKEVIKDIITDPVFNKTLQKLNGSFALGIIFKKYNTRVSFFMCIFVVYNLDIDRMTN